MGRDCTLWALDSESGELFQCDLDRSYVFDYVGGIHNALCDQFISRADTNHWLDFFRTEDNKRSDEEGERKEYHLYWVSVAQSFVDKFAKRFPEATEDFLFTIVPEESDVEDRRKQYAHDLVHAQWPRCPHCQSPEGCQKKADRLSETFSGIYEAECSHMGKSEKRVWLWKPDKLENWVLELALPDYGEKFDQP